MLRRPPSMPPSVRGIASGLVQEARVRPRHCPRCKNPTDWCRRRSVRLSGHAAAPTMHRGCRGDLARHTQPGDGCRLCAGNVPWRRRPIDSPRELEYRLELWCGSTGCSRRRYRLEGQSRRGLCARGRLPWCWRRCR